MRGASVELRNVCKSFAHHAVVRDVSLQISRGEFFSLLGPSGCGKTTALRLIAGFEHADRGDILYDGKRQAEPAYARVVNMVFQHYALFPHLTVWRNVAFGLEVQRLPSAEIARRVDEALEQVHLQGLDARYPAQLSGGQQQRVALARAIVTEPSVLLLDEPLGALDLKLRKAMQLELKSLQRRLGLTFIYVTHDQDEALAMSDRIAVMHRGRILQAATPDELYERPATRFVAEFIGESNLIPAALARRLAWRVPTSDGADLFAIRPEKIALSSAPATADNCVRGTIEDSLYFGTDTQYSVRVDRDLVLTVRAQNLGHAPHARGAPVYASWHAQAAVPVAPDPDADLDP